MRAAALAVLLLAVLQLASAAQTVALAGRMGGRALLLIDGRSQMLAPGETAQGVKLLRLDAESAVIEQRGVRSTLVEGAAPLRLGAAGGTGGAAREIVIPAGSGGHFVTAGSINGRAVRFMVDTGATAIALDRTLAERIGIDWRRGERLLMHTANGDTEAHRVTLASVRVGEVELLQLPAVVIPAQMPLVLLGNTFLARFQMRRDNDLMRLELRP